MMATDQTPPVQPDHLLYAPVAINLLIGTLVEKGLLTPEDHEEYSQNLTALLEKMGNTFNR